MNYTFPVTKEMAYARTSLTVSRKHAQFICKAVNRKPYMKARKLIENLADEKVSLPDGHYYTKSASQILRLLNVLVSNAKAKNLPYEKMKLFICVHKGPALYRMRTKNMYGKKLKVCNVQVVLKGG